jgi:hypothetical protein
VITGLVGVISFDSSGGLLNGTSAPYLIATFDISSSSVETITLSIQFDARACSIE